jgi:hypothetical protein
MQHSAWPILLRKIPVEKHDKLSLVTTSGVEITVQAILRIEREFLALKGRLSGSQQAGRVFFVPYAHIDYIGSQFEIKDADFEAFFGKGDPTAINVISQKAALAAKQAVKEEKPAEEAAAAVAAPAPEPVVAVSPSVVGLKNPLLDRIRARTNGEAASQPKPGSVQGTTLLPKPGGSNQGDSLRPTPGG